jgi:hypothetical protein
MEVDDGAAKKSLVDEAWRTPKRMTTKSMTVR